MDGVQERHDAHDQSCESLRWYWWARRGGVTALGDVGDCTDCEAWFYVEGLAWLGQPVPSVEDPDPDDVCVCACCAGRRGLVIAISEHGGIYVPGM
jgi:hypothetical protein